MDFTDRTIGPYQVLSQIGQGGMGTVYRAMDTRLNRPVAIKFLQQHLWLDASARSRMMVEAKAASSLDHPNIGTIYEIGDGPDTGLYIVMAFYAGQSLSDLLHNGPLTVPHAMRLATEIAEGLACAHAHKIIHRDIKPANIILTSEGLVKILDFGMAKSDDLHLTKPGTLLGTPSFMSPEQIRGERIDYRCDLWALGVALFKMVTGKMPFSGKSLPLLTSQILAGKPNLSLVPESVRPLLEKALARNIDDRFQSAKAFIAALEGRPAPDPWESTITMSFPQTAMAAHASSVVSDKAAAKETKFETPLPSQQLRGRTQELRQVTLATCELVDASAIETSCGLEVLREIQIEYERLCSAVTSNLEGEAVPRGDGEVRLHFGYPAAHEDDAFRAVTAGLRIVAGMADIRERCRSAHSELSDCAISARIGIHTGSAIASGGDSTQLSVVGSAGSFSLRTQQAANFGEVWVTADTLQLVNKRFEARPAGQLNGLRTAAPMALFAITASIDPEQSIQAPSDQIELVSRDRELGLLMDCWKEVQDGHGQTVLISGDAGIGKSRLVWALRSRLHGEQALVVAAGASPYFVNSPLYPVLQIVGQLLGFERTDSPEERLRKVRAALLKAHLDVADGLAILAPLLNLPLSSNVASPRMDAQRQRERQFSTILKLLELAATVNPVVWILEDLHCADPTTLELMGTLVKRGGTARVFTLMTSRAEYSPPWAENSNLQPVQLGRLSRRDAELMIRRLAANKPLPPEIVARVVENADGVPLFVEELTRDVLGSGALRETPDSYVLAGPIASLAIPRTLKETLAARLDRLGDAKEVAQFASILGRTFWKEWLQSICQMEEDEIQAHLLHLVEAGIVLRQGGPGSAEYSFKHALIKDAAYQSMLPGMRQQYHARFAQSLVTQFPEMAEEHPELVAHQFTSAGLNGDAIVFWRKAGEDSRRRSANQEAVAHFSKGLELAPSLPKSPERLNIELSLWTALAGAQLAIDGYAANRVGESFQRVRELGQMAGLDRPLFDALQGEWAFKVVRADLESALETAARLQAIADKLKDPALQSEAVLRRGITLSMLGNLVEARACLEHVAASASTDDHRDSARLFGQDRIVACFCHLALVQCLQGEIHTAIKTADRAIALAQELAHTFTIAWAYLYGALLQALLGNAAQTREYASSLKQLSEEQGFSYRLAQAQVLAGWAALVEMQDLAGLPGMRKAIDRVLQTGARVYRAFYFGLYADASLQLGANDEALAAIEDELQGPRSSERMFEAFQLSMKAELMMHSPKSAKEKIAEILKNAAQTARQQGARLLELRARYCLSTLYPENLDAARELHEVLASVDSYSAMTLISAAQARVAESAHTNDAV